MPSFGACPTFWVGKTNPDVRIRLKPEMEFVDMLGRSAPCQPSSYAGKKKEQRCRKNANMTRYEAGYV